jgi:integrase
LAEDYKRDFREGRLFTPPPSVSFAELAADWQVRFLSGYTAKEADRKRYLLDSFVLPAIGGLSAAAVTPRIILEGVLRPLEALGKLSTAAKVKSVVSLIFRYGVASGQVQTDPARDLAGALRAPKPVHRPAILDPAGIGKLMNDILAYEGTPVVAAALKLLPYVFTRPGELRNAEWAEIDLGEGVWSIPFGRMKMRSPHLVPLSRQAAGILSDLRPLTGTGRLVFPGARTVAKPISDMALGAALRNLGYAQGTVCPHGFRAMASTTLNRLGYPSDWIERQLAHSEHNGVRAAYNHADWFKDRKRMMQEWADHLDGLAEAARA